MGKLKIVVASPNRSSAGRVSQMLMQFPDFELLPPVDSVQELMSCAESVTPHMAIISTKLTALPDFDVVAQILRASDVRWVAIGGSSSGALANGGVPVGSGLFEVSVGAPPHVLAQQIRSVCRNARTPSQNPSPAASVGGKSFDKVILLGASTGGVDSLLHVLGGFPVDAPPTVIVQHTGSSYLAGLSKLLDRKTSCRVVAADRRMELERGKVYLAATAGAHLTFRRTVPLQCDIHQGPPVSGHRPSVDALFQSAVPHAKRIVAVLMTGMGRDGATGLKALKDAGATTAAQDQATSVVYGMPRVAAELGAADHILPLHDIANFVLSNADMTARSDR